MQLQQVLMNLLVNSIEAMKDIDGTRELVITSQRGENEQALVSISDTGVGLPPQHADQDLQCILHHQASRHRHGTSHQLLHRRIARRTLVGSRQLSARRNFLLHPARRSRDIGW